MTSPPLKLRNFSPELWRRSVREPWADLEREFYRDDGELRTTEELAEWRAKNGN